MVAVPQSHTNVKNRNAVATDVSSKLYAILEWGVQGQVNFAGDKTKVMVITRFSAASHIMTDNISMKDITMTLKKFTSVLGVDIDNNLSTSTGSVEQLF